MASLLGVPRACGIKSGNTGQATCDIKLDKIVMLLLCKDGFKVPASELGSDVDVLAYLQEKSIAALPKDRLFPFKTIKGYTENTEAAEIIKYGFGDFAGRNEKAVTFEMDSEYLGVGHYKRLRAWLDDKSTRAFVITTSSIHGEKDKDGNLVPFEANFNPQQVKIGNGADAVTKTMVDIAFRNPKAFSDDLNGYQFEDGTSSLFNELFGCVDLRLSTPSSFVVKANVAISNLDMYDEYADALAVVGAWEMKNAITGAVVPITSVVKNPTYKGWTILPNATPCDIKTVNPAALAALNVGSTTSGGFETEGGVRLGE